MSVYLETGKIVKSLYSVVVRHSRRVSECMQRRWRSAKGTSVSLRCYSPIVRLILVWNCISCEFIGLWICFDLLVSGIVGGDYG